MAGVMGYNAKKGLLNFSSSSQHTIDIPPYGFTLFSISYGPDYGVYLIYSWDGVDHIHTIHESADNGISLSFELNERLITVTSNKTRSNVGYGFICLDH